MNVSVADCDTTLDADPVEVAVIDDVNDDVDDNVAVAKPGDDPTVYDSSSDADETPLPPTPLPPPKLNGMYIVYDYVNVHMP